MQPRGSYFFHTGFGKDQSIRVDLGRRHRVRRIEVTNRQGGFQERAKHIFAVLTEDGSGQGVRRVFPMYETGRLPGGAWQECGIEVPEVSARYVTITSPMDTALHFADLRIYAADRDRPTGPTPRWTPRRVLRGVRRRLRRCARADRGHGSLLLIVATRRASPSRLGADEDAGWVGEERGRRGEGPDGAEKATAAGSRLTESRRCLSR